MDLLEGNIAGLRCTYGDYVEIRDGRINNLAYEVKVL
jgi:hypothetical protein